ncbi:uncharacterized protein BX663DRAFT_427049 [Cokeromyces recurvatus]|uniref:uncharacterized protein n=1 Tax=Cokeromyces recurvatus TaxID=90255 RepID=UPI00221E60A9|nr:uncharacterized protein BX663DRAFT_427049 [Cokeromyces recurvatus]KAI7907164.1 hypothetical protein BX663DRAFT_427049 [Cokeromyces recurvatus]
MTLSNLHDTSLCGLEEDSSSIVNNLEYNLNSVTTHHVSSKDKDCIHNNNNNQSEKKDVNCIAAYNNSGYNRFIPQPITPTISSRKGIGVTLKSAETGAFTGEFQILDEQVQYWIQHANNRYDKRCMLQIRSESTSSSKKEDVLFPPSYCLVQLIEPKGLSVISDIDDTIKVTGVLAGTRSILSNTFFKPTRAVYGMADVYSRWYNHGVAFHYVSNSPFQLIHVLHQFMRNHNFPPGSFHLKNTFTFISKFVETSGRFKVGTICRIIHDFPHRMFVLVGDSSEMDLEIYTQIAIKFPNRILKIFIRDMTSQANMEQMKKKKKNKKKKINNKRRSSTSPSLFSNSTKKQKEDNQRSQSAPIRSNSTPVFTFSQLSKNNKVDDDNEEEEEDDDDDNDEQVASKLANLGFISEENSSTSYNNLSITKSSPDNISSFTDYHPTSSDPLHLYTRVAHARKLLKHVDIVLFKDASELLTDEDILAHL